MTRARSGAMDAPLVFFLAVLLAATVTGTVTRRMDASRHAVRLELHAQLVTALESLVEEAWWVVCRAVPARSGAGGEARRPRGNDPDSLRSRVLGALCERRGSTATPADVVPTIGARVVPPGVVADVTLDDVNLTVARVEGGGLSGLVALSAEGAARRGPVQMRVRIEHRRRFTVTLTELAGPRGARSTLGTIYIEPELFEAEVGEP